MKEYYCTECPNRLLCMYYVVIAAQLVIVECIPQLKWSMSETGRLEIALFAAGNLNQQRFIDVVRVVLV